MNVTEKVKEFYEKFPFPNYENLETSDDLIKKSEKGIFAKLLNEQIPKSYKILEVGCGTGQLSNFLGILGRSVVGVDICEASLSLANKFRSNNNLNSVSFQKMDLFNPCFDSEAFDLVICSGVLHHTDNPKKGFESICRLVKKNGYIIIGLYNKWGRLKTDFRRIIFNLTGDRFKFLDPILRSVEIGETKKNIWFKDQYKHPHELKHTYGEVLKWFEDNNTEFINSIPKICSSFKRNEQLFYKNSSGNKLLRFMTQYELFIRGSREGGFFIMIGRKQGG